MTLNKHSPYIYTAFLVLILSLFRIPISRILDAVIVEPIFASFDKGWWIDVSVLVGIALLIFLIWRERPKKSTIKIVLYGLIFYSFQRVNPYWEFTGTASIPQLAYWDVVAIALVFSIPYFFLLQRKNVETNNISSIEGFVEDNSVSDYENDHFKRQVAATEIARLIQLTNNSKSFAIGVLGEYGSGKTSFLNLINLGLTDDNILKITFNPWSAGNAEMIRRDFFDLLAIKVANIDQKISSLIYSYGRRLASIDTRSQFWLNWLGFFRNSGSLHSSREFEQINQMLKSTGRKIIITIDDLDRLYPAEIMEVLKLIRNTADFSNVFYIVGYDKEYVQDAMRTLNESGGIDFLDKIFQLEIPLPKREENDLLFVLQHHLKRMISEYHFSIFEDSMIPNGFQNRYEKAYYGVFRQSRDVVRFLNGFKIVYNLIGEEVEFECLMLLELIKFRYPSIYDLIYKQSDRFLYDVPVRSSYEQYLVPRMLKGENSGKKSDEVSVFRKHLEQINWLSDEDVSLLDGLFLTLFKGGLYNGPKSKNSISYPLYFEIYFRHRLSQTDLSDKDYKAAMNSNKMGEYMKYCATHNLHKELMIRFMQEDIFQDRLHFEQVIRWIFSFGPTFMKKENTRYFSCEPLIDKIYNYENIITEKLYKKDTQAYFDFINLLFDIAKPPYLFENNLIHHLKKKGGNFVIPNTQLTAHQLSYFTNYAESGHGLNEDVVWIFWGAKEHYQVPADESGGYYSRWRFEPDLAVKMKDYLKTKDPLEFLKYSIKWNMYEPLFACIYKEVLDIFDGPEEYRQIIEDNPAVNKDIKDEYLELFDKCKTEGWEKFVAMDFKTALGKPE